jgi:putative ABC transport system ATP-binding protein
MMIRAEGLEKSYTSGGRPLPVLRSIDLEVQADAFVAIVGPSGSGKTTLLGLLAGLDEPTAGKVWLDGENIFALSEDGRADFRAKNVGFVFQTFHLLPTLTALENVLVPLELRGEARGARDRAASLLERVGLGERLDHYPPQLSGGEQQRVALARAFANEPKILFADEPTGNLDQETGAGIVEILEELNRDARTTLVLVTHDLALAERAHRVVTLGGGVVVSDRPGARGSAPAAATGGPGRGPSAGAGS